MKKGINYNCWVFQYLENQVLDNLIPEIDKFITYSMQYKNLNQVMLVLSLGNFVTKVNVRN